MTHVASETCSKLPFSLRYTIITINFDILSFYIRVLMRVGVIAAKFPLPHTVGALSTRTWRAIHQLTEFYDINVPVNSSEKLSIVGSSVVQRVYLSSLIFHDAKPGTPRPASETGGGERGAIFAVFIPISSRQTRIHNSAVRQSERRGNGSRALGEHLF